MDTQIPWDPPGIILLVRSPNSSRKPGSRVARASHARLSPAAHFPGRKCSNSRGLARKGYWKPAAGPYVPAADSPKKLLDTTRSWGGTCRRCTMTFQDASARRRGPRKASPETASPLLRVAALFGLAVLLGGLALPLTALVLEDDPPSFCCTRGRCCCWDDTAGDDRTCLRRGCGCEHRDDAANGAPLQIEAVLRSPAPVRAASPSETRWPSADERPIARAQPPTVPPPRRSLPA
jgi:hypothetical protein